MNQSHKIFYTVSGDDLGIISDGIVDPEGTVYSAVMRVDQDNDLGFTLQTTGTLEGAFTLWYSDKDKPALDSDDDWVEDEQWSPTDPTGTATKVKYVVAGMKTRLARVKFVQSAGTGTLYGYNAAGK